MYIQVGDTRILQENFESEGIKAAEINKVQNQKEILVEAQENLLESVEEKRGMSAKEREEALIYAVGITQKAEYPLVGADSDIESLDIAKAISDMQKDSILQEYQYFVRSAKEMNEIR